MAILDLNVATKAEYGMFFIAFWALLDQLVIDQAFCKTKSNGKAKREVGTTPCYFSESY